MWAKVSLGFDTTRKAVTWTCNKGRCTGITGLWLFFFFFWLQVLKFFWKILRAIPDKPPAVVGCASNAFIVCVPWCPTGRHCKTHHIATWWTNTCSLGNQCKERELWMDLGWGGNSLLIRIFTPRPSSLPLEEPLIACRFISLQLLQGVGVVKEKADSSSGPVDSCIQPVLSVTVLYHTSPLPSPWDLVWESDALVWFWLSAGNFAHHNQAAAPQNVFRRSNCKSQFAGRSSCCTEKELLSTEAVSVRKSLAGSRAGCLEYSDSFLLSSDCSFIGNWLSIFDLRISCSP